MTLREADIVIIHTGWGDLFMQYPAKNAEFKLSLTLVSPGIGKDVAKWLIDQKVVAVGADQWAVEVIPGEDPKEAFIVHNMLITDNGIHIIENVPRILAQPGPEREPIHTYHCRGVKPTGSPAVQRSGWPANQTACRGSAVRGLSVRD